jgi:acyl-CoA dehydrogenase
MDFDLSPRSEAWREKLQAFFDAEVLPRHRAWLDHAAKGEAAPFMGDLQRKARAAGLWNLGLPELTDDEPGTRLSNLEYAPLAEIMGRLFWAPEVFNCQAPDVPNMIALQNCATPEQKARWLPAPDLSHGADAVLVDRELAIPGRTSVLSGGKTTRSGNFLKGVFG